MAKVRTPNLIRVTGAMITLMISVSQSCAASDEITIARQRLDQQFNKAVQKLVEQSRDDSERQRRQQAFLPGDRSRQYLYIPNDVDSDTVHADDPELRKVQRIFGDRLFELATRSLEVDQAARAYQWLHEVLKYVPDHKQVNRALNLPKEQTPRIRRGQRLHPKYQWKPGSYLQVDTPNFRITTNGNELTARKLAETLEQLNSVWRQLFFDYWGNAAMLQAAMNGRPLIKRRKAKHQVVLFQDRNQYIEFLSKIEPQAQMTLGYYDGPTRTAFFFGDESNQSTWRHEATHQLFQESKRTRLGVGETANFWIVEGTALYMESLKRSNDFVTVGGLESDRLQFARYRVLRESFYVPIERFAALGRKELQEDPNIRKLYSQAAGLTHFFMNSENGKYRSSFVDYIKSVYAHQASAESLLSFADRSATEIDHRYRDFLDVDDIELSQLDPAIIVRNLALGSTRITDQGLQGFDRLEDLVWLDLKGTNISDLGTTRFPSAKALNQLSLEETNVGNETVKRLANAHRLQDLDLSHTKIDDAAIQTIVQLPNLKILWLSGTQITDKGIRQLQGHANLREVDVSGTNVTPEAWQELRDSLTP